MNLIIVILLVFLFLYFCNLIEGFEPSKWFIINEMPWWNSTRKTRNMIYDIRGDPLIIPKKKYIWNNTDRNY
jgi:hypothetical protein